MFQPTSSNNRGVEICVEAHSEWKIEEIDYEGIERYIKPYTFKELVAKNANRIKWRDIVGREASIGNREDTSSSSDDSETEQEKREIAKKIQPAAGPWADVAKHMHQSLQEVNMLLDTLCIMRTNYVIPTAVSTMIIAGSENKTAEKVAASKAFQFCARRKAFGRAAACLNLAMKARTEIDCADKNLFFKELRRMRQNYRVRKVNNCIFGDLGYKLYGPRFNPGELFDISRRTQKPYEYPSYYQQQYQPAGETILQVQMPRHLMRRSALCVFVYRDTAKNAENLFGDRKEPPAISSSKHVYWEHAIKWAQNTLVCKDTLTQLAQDCVEKKRICIQAENCLLVSLFDDIVLKVVLKQYPFKEMPIPHEGVLYLNHMLIHLFLSDHNKRIMRNQQFVSMPQTFHAENLDMRGPQALSADEIASRKLTRRSLLERFVELSSHYILIRKVSGALQKQVHQYGDPQLTWKWIRSTNIFSIAAVVMVNCGYDYLGRLPVMIQINDSKITVVKDHQRISCGRDMRMFEESLLIFAANFFLNSVAFLSKVHSWQIFHANSNALSEHGNLAPTFYACNPSASKSLFIQLLTDGSPPAIFLRENDDPSETVTKTLKDGGNEMSSTSENNFLKLDYSKIPGSSFIRKMDYLLLSFKN